MLDITNTETTLKELGFKSVTHNIGFRLHIDYKLNREDILMLDTNFESLAFPDKKTAEEAAKLLEQEYKKYCKEDKGYFHYSIYELTEKIYCK